MNLLLRALFMSTTAIALGAQAGVRVSGGGHSVVCDGGTPNPTYQLLDLYEVPHVFSSHVDLPPDGNFSDPNVRVQEKAMIMLERLRALSPLRYAWYQREVNGFFASLSRFTVDDLRFMNDSYYEILGKNCVLAQVALQQERGYIGDPSFFVNAPLWDKFDLNSRAALLLHEIIYNELLSYGHTDSVSARRLVGFLASNYFQQHKLLNFLVDLHSSKVPDTDIGGMWVHLWDFAVDENPLRSRKLKLYDDRLVQTVIAEAYPNFEETSYPLPNLFSHLRTYNPFYEVRNSRLRIAAERSQQLLPIEIQLSPAQQVVGLRTRELADGPATLWIQNPDQSWRQVHELGWDNAGNLTLAK